MKYFCYLFLVPGMLTLAKAQPFDLAVNITIAPHVGQAFNLRVVETVSGNEVAREEMESITEENFTIEFVGILEAEKSYNVDFYADNNENGVYDAPSDDHAWRETISDVSEAQAITWRHSGSFIDIEYPDEPPAGVRMVDKNIPMKVEMKSGKLYINAYIPGDLEVQWAEVNGQLKFTSKFKLDGKTIVNLPLPDKVKVGRIFMNGKLSGVVRLR